MHIQDLLPKHRPTFSFEFFPPKTKESAANLFDTIRELEALQPSFVSVTYGAGGGTRELTHELVLRLKNETSLTPIPHLTCVCHSQEEIESILESYAQAGVENILALGGDPPRHLPDHDRASDAFPRATDLVRFIRQFNASGRHSDPRGFGIGVAGFPEGHPATANRLQEMDYFKEKIDAGADYICTQLFFDNRDFLDFRDRCQLAGIDIPIIAGIMPVTTQKGMRKMADLAAGSRFPAKLLRALDRCQGDPEAVAHVGVHYATEQCAGLLDEGVDGLHMYTLNQSRATREIYAGLGLIGENGKPVPTSPAATPATA